MTDPYQVLGISRNASEEEIKRAYRKLSRLYHPDSNINNPNKAQAEERFKEVQSAYKMIMEGAAGAADIYGDYGQPSYAAQEETDRESMYYQATANFIRNRMYQEASRTLNDIKERDGRWYYFSAMTNAGLGKHATALSHIKIAIEKEPNKYEYRQFLSRLQSGGEWYEQKQNTYKMPEEGFSFGFRLCLTTLFCSLCSGGSVCCCAPTPWSQI